jgi:hypothetical protein
MTLPESSQFQIRRIPRIKLEALKILHRLLRNFLLSLQSETEADSGGVINEKLQANPNSSQSFSRTEGAASSNFRERKKRSRRSAKITDSIRIQKSEKFKG